MPIYRPSLKRQFQDWVDRKDRSVKYQSGDTVTINKNTVIDPEYKRIVNVVYEANGGVGTPLIDETNYVIGDTVTIAESPYTKEYCTFAGWMRPNDTTYYKPGDKFTIPDMYDDLIFEAQWEHEPDSDHTIVYTAGGGGGQQEQDPNTYYNGDKVHIPECTYTAPEGMDMEFAQWYIDKKPHAVILHPGDKYKVVPEDAKIIEIGATWTERKHTVEFSAVHATGTQTPDEKTYIMGKEIPIPDCEFDHEIGYVFDCWYVMCTDEGIPKAPGETYKVQDRDPLVIKIVAEFIKSEHSVEFAHGEHVSGGTQPEDSTVYGYGDAIPIPVCKYEAEDGYQFTHWLVETGSGTVKKQPGETYTVQDGDPAVITMTAIFEQKIYRVKFSYRGEAEGSQPEDERGYACGEYITLPPCKYTAKRGNQFSCWYVVSAVGEVPYLTGEKYQIKDEDSTVIEIIAAFVKTEYTITFYPGSHAGGSQPDNPKILNLGSVLVMPECGFTLDTEYEFVNWQFAPDGSELQFLEPGDTYTIDDDDLQTIDVIANCTQIKHTVEFSCNEYGEGTQKKDTTQYLKGQVITIPTHTYTPISSTYVFDHWVIKNTVSGDVRKNDGDTYTVQAGDPKVLQIQAVFTVEEYYAVFEPDKGSGSMADMGPYTKGYKFILPECSFTAPESYYAFKNWIITTRTGEIQRAAKNTYVIGDNDYRRIVCKANWSEVYYTIEFNENGGSGTQPKDTTHYHVGDKITMPECKFSPSGDQEFDTWLIVGPAGSLHILSPGEEYTVPELSASTIVATAQWKQVEHWIYYSPTTDCKETEQHLVPGTFKEGEEYTIEADIFTPKTGYKFANYFYADKAGNRCYISPNEKLVMGAHLNKEIAILPNMVTKDTSLYTVKYWHNTHSSGDLPSDIHVYTKGESVTVPECPCTFDAGYEFYCWRLYRGNGKYDDLQPGSSYQFGSREEDEDHKTNMPIKVQEQLSKYTVTFDANGGSGSMKDEDFYYIGSSIDCPSCEFTAPEGYGFSHWEITNKEGKAEEYDPDVSYTIDEHSTNPIVMKAIWSDAKYTVTFNAGEGSGDQKPDPNTYLLDQWVRLPICTYDYYGIGEFTYWVITDTLEHTFYVDELGTFRIGRYDTNPIQATAQWGVVTHTLHYVQGEHGSGEQTEGETSADTDYLITLPECTFQPDDGYRFDCWEVTYKDGTSEQMSAGTTIRIGRKFSRDVFIIAIWHPYLGTKIEYEKGSHMTDTGLQPEDETLYQCGGVITLPECKYIIDDGWEFKDWRLNVNGGAETREAGQTYTIPEGELETITANARAFPVSDSGAVYEVEYTAGTGSGSQTQDDSKYSLGDIVTMYPCEFTAPKGKSFKCWRVTTAKSRTWTDLQPGEIYEITENDNELINICAIWK